MEVRHSDGSPPYLVESTHSHQTALVFPGPTPTSSTTTLWLRRALDSFAVSGPARTGLGRR